MWLWLWISKYSEIHNYEPPSKYFSDNGGEFSNENYNEMCQLYNITVKKTAAEASFSKGLVERHDAVLENMLLQTCEDKNISIEIALQWVINSKNSLTNVHGFSPYQLVFSFSPKLPHIFINRPPALEEPNISKLVAYNLNAMHSARKAFVASESLGTYQHPIFATDDTVYYKRKKQQQMERTR